MLNDVFEDARDRMGKVLEDLRSEYKRVRTGRASVSLVESIRADYYGTSTPLNQLATLTIPDPRTIVIQPWDQSAVGDVE